MEIHRLSDYPGRQVERSSFRQQATQIKETKTPNLSQDEEQMITKEFTGTRNRTLKLYVANGEVKNEQPSAKGRNIDFRV